MKINKTILNFWNAHITTIVLIVMLSVFIGSSTFFALKLKRAIIPDEPAHFYMSQRFSTTLGIPPNTDKSLTLGLDNMDRNPFLYYWLNGRILEFLRLVRPAINDWQQLVFLRLTSIFYSTLSVVFCYQLAKEIIKSRWGHLLVVFMITNTLMFVFLSSGVSYDNFVNLCCFAGIYYLVCVLIGKSFFSRSLGCLACIATGTLAKFTVLPLAAVICLLWVIYVVKNRHQIDFRPEWNWKLTILLMLGILLIGVNLFIYGVNLVKYKAIIPSCYQISTPEQCNRSVFVQRRIDLNYPENKLTLLDVIEKQKPDPLEYLTDYWFPSMLLRTYGIMGHKIYFPDLIITFYRILYFIVFLAIVRYWQKPAFIIGSLITIFIIYMMVLFWQNYNIELITNFLHIGIQGRYIFPVIGILYTLIVYYITQIPRALIRQPIVTFTLLLFFLGSPIWVFIMSYASLADWFA
jgi:hypothetical protein